MKKKEVIIKTENQEVFEIECEKTAKKTLELIKEQDEYCKSVLDFKIKEGLTEEEAQLFLKKELETQVTENEKIISKILEKIDNSEDNKREIKILLYEILEKIDKVEKEKLKSKDNKAIPIPQNRLATPILSEYRSSLNKGGFIGILDESFINKIDFSEGRAYLKNDVTQSFTIETLKKHEVENKNFDYVLLHSIYSVIFQTQDKIEGSKVFINRKDLEGFTGINSRGENINDFIKKVSTFNQAYGFLPNGSHYKLLTYIGYDKEMENFEFDIKFILELLKIQETERIINKKEKKTHILKNHSFLTRSEISNERNKTAVFMIRRMEQLLISAGTNTKNPRISVKTLINDIPQLKEELERTETNKYPTPEKNKILKKHFTKFYQLIKEKTEFYSYFIELHIPEIIPTSSTLDTVIYITHKGINKEFKPLN